MTMATFPPESRSDQLFNLPGEAAMYFDEDGTLYIDLITDDGTLAFAPGNMETVETSEPWAIISHRLLHWKCTDPAG